MSWHEAETQRPIILLTLRKIHTLTLREHEKTHLFRLIFFKSIWQIYFSHTRTHTHTFQIRTFQKHARDEMEENKSERNYRIIFICFVTCCPINAVAGSRVTVGSLSTYLLSDLVKGTLACPLTLIQLTQIQNALLLMNKTIFFLTIMLIIASCINAACIRR